MAINKTAAGTFAVDFRDQFKKRHQKTFDTHKEAVAYEKQTLSQVENKQYIRPVNDTVKEIAEKWHQRKVDAGTYKRSSLKQWKNHVDNFIIAELGYMKLKNIDGNIEAVEKAAAAWAERVAPTTANKILTTLTAVLELAKRWKQIRENPAQTAERLKLATADEDGEIVTPDKVYTRAQLKRLIGATVSGTLDRVLIMVPALLGLRIGEVLALTWAAINPQAAKLRVMLNLADSDKGQPSTLESPKSASSRRTLNIPPELLTELIAWKAKCPKSERDLVFATIDGKPYHRKAASKILDAAIKKAKLEKRLTPHGLRHTFASLLLMRRTPVVEVAHLLGHKDANVTHKVYAHFIDEETKTVENLAASIFAVDIEAELETVNQWEPSEEQRETVH